MKVPGSNPSQGFMLLLFLIFLGGLDLSFASNDNGKSVSKITLKLETKLII